MRPEHSIAANVLDLFSRKVVGWSMAAIMNAHLVFDALMMAICGKPVALLHHSDEAVSIRARTSSGCSPIRASPAA